MQFPRNGATIYQPLPGKVGVSIPIFEVGLRLPMTNLSDGIMCQYGFSADDMNFKVVNKFVGFELAC